MARQTSTAGRPPELPGQMDIFDIINREPESTEEQQQQTQWRDDNDTQISEKSAE